MAHNDMMSGAKLLETAAQKAALDDMMQKQNDASIKEF